MLFANKRPLRESGSDSRAEWAETAGVHFDSGYNCAQSVMLAAASAYELEFPEAMIRGMASFTGGIGNSGCTCGALVAAALVAGIVTGDLDKSMNDKKAKKAAADIIGRFKESYGSSCCRALKNGLRGKEANKKCRELTTGATAILLEVLSIQHCDPVTTSMTDRDRQQKQDS